MIKNLKVLGEYIVGISIAFIGLFIDFVYFGYELLKYGLNGFIYHFLEDLPEHLTLISVLMVFPVLGFFINLYISERETFQKKLKEQTDFISSILNTVSLSIFTISPDYRIITYNRASADLFGYGEEEVIGSDVKILFSNSGEYRNVIDELEKKGSFDGEVTLKSKVVEIPCSLSIRRLTDENGRVRAYIFVAMDISAEKEKEELKNRIFLAEKLASIGKLAAGVAHEINNPLTSASLITERLIEKYSDNPELNIKLQKVKNKVDMAGKIAREMLSISKSPGFKFEEINLNEILNEAMESLDIPENIEIDSSVGDIKIYGDASQIRKVFNNIILNAIQAMPEGGKITIRAYDLVRKIIIEISDTGTGIKKEIIEKIFDPFFTTREVGKGSGLGLYIAHGIIKSHGGEIYIDSEEGYGTTVSIVFLKNNSGSQE